VDVNAIRSQFIKDGLRCALEQQDKESAARTLRAFRNYFQWFESQLPEREKITITGQFAKLDQVAGTESSEKQAFPG
jgi:hypothetical protein